MLRCPVCGNGYTDDKQFFCLSDGAALVRMADVSAPTAQFGGAGNRPAHPVAAPPNVSAQPPTRKKTVFWILGGVGVLMVVLFIGVLIVVGLLANYKKTGDPLNSNIVKTSPTPVTVTSGKYEPELRMAISGANVAETTSRATLNSAGLEKYYSGEALKSIKGNVDQLKSLKMLQVAVIKNQDYEYFKLNDAATEAEVRVVETWEVTSYRVPDAKCLSYNPPMRLPQVIYLKKSPSGWMIDAVVPDQGVKTDPQPCPKKK